MHLLKCKCSEKLRPYAPLVLRLAVGLVFLVHGYMKIQDVGQVTTMFGSLGIPGAAFFAWVVTLVELLGGVALIVGLWVHLASKLLAIDMLVALFLVHFKQGFLVTNGGYEYALVLFAATLALMIMGGGAYSLQKSK